MRTIGYPFPRALALLAALSGVALTARALQLTPAATPAASSPSEKDLEKARLFLSRHQFGQAAAFFTKANALAGGKCFACLEGLAAANIRLKEFAGAVSAARGAIQAAGSSAESARGYNQLGLALAGKAKKDPKELAEAEDAYRKALELSEGKMNAMRYNLAVVVLRSGRQKEGLVLLDEYLKLEPPGMMAEQARTLRSIPHRAGENFSPRFDLVTLTGERITLETLRGKVVLLDFWATWCGPCLKALPELKDLKKKMAQERFEIVSISVDRDRNALEAFIKKHEVSWPQYFDKNSQVARDLFQVGTFPTYLLVDHEGVIVYGIDGWSPSTGAKLADQVQKAVEKIKSTKAERHAESMERLKTVSAGFPAAPGAKKSPAAP